MHDDTVGVMMKHLKVVASTGRALRDNLISGPGHQHPDGNPRRYFKYGTEFGVSNFREPSSLHEVTLTTCCCNNLSQGSPGELAESCHRPGVMIASASTQQSLILIQHGD